MNANTDRYFVAISLIKGLGHINAKKLIAACGSPEAVFKEKRSILANFKMGRHILDQISGKELLNDADEEMLFVDKNNINLIHFHKREYPFRLKQCEDAPLVIYTKGNVDLNPERSLAVVGTRRASRYGLEKCGEIIQDLGLSRVQIISGLADGIDTAAHQAALSNNLHTVAVLGHSLNRIYPRNNRDLSKKIEHSGALLTDFPSSSSMVPGNFPSRNRIIAGLSDATLVIESGLKGGSLITADLALSYNREVFALPGRAGDKNSAGCNQLIKDTKAALIENAGDLNRCLNWDEVKSRINQQKLFVDLSEDELKVVELLKKRNCVKIDEISTETGLSINKTSGVLLNLEFKNTVKSMPGKMYSLTV